MTTKDTSKHRDCRPSPDDPYLSCEAAPETHDVHPFLTCRAGAKATAVATRMAASLASDLRLGLRSDVKVPLDVVQDLPQVLQAEVAA